MANNQRNGNRDDDNDTKKGGGTGKSGSHQGSKAEPERRAPVKKNAAPRTGNTDHFFPDKKEMVFRLSPFLAKCSPWKLWIRVFLSGRFWTLPRI